MADTRGGDAGVTLIEILVVLTLIGVSAGIVTYALPSAAPARTLDQESALLVTRLNLAAERSLIQGQHYRLDWDSDSYGFEEWRDGAWHLAARAPLRERHALARGAILRDERGAQRGAIRITPDLMPGGAGIARLQIEGGATDRTVSFDGTAAFVDAGGVP